MNIPMLREIIEERKTRAVETLSAGYAKNRLPLEEYERLVEYINKIESERELAVVEKIVAEYSVDEKETPSADTGSYGDDDDEPEFYPHHGTPNMPAGFSLLSSRTYSGPVKSGSQFVSILGSQHIKIRKADLSRSRNFLEIVSIFGETVVFVEPGIRVNNKAIPILGGSWTDNKVNKLANDRDYELNISGAALFGNITVKLLKEKYE